MAELNAEQKEKILDIAAKLETGVEADIWYDAAENNDKPAELLISQTNEAMREAAKFLRSLAEQK